MAKNYLTIILEDKIYTQRKPNSKYIEIDLKGNEINKHNEVPSEIDDIVALYKRIEENPRDYIDYEILDLNNTVKINRIYDSPDINVHFKIPSHIEGYPVSVISSNVLCEDLRLKLEQIDIPDSVEVFFPSAFANAIKLKNFFVPENTKYLSEKCFYNCDQLSTIFLNNVKELKNAVFDGCESLTRLNLSKVRLLGRFCFANCTSLKEVNLSDDLLNIPIGTFYNCRLLTSIHLPDSVKSVFDNAFAYCDNLTNISIGAKTEYDGDAFTYKQLLNLKTRKEEIVEETQR